MSVVFPRDKYPMKNKPKDYKSEYMARYHAIGRCHNSNHKDYKNYGARGIHVCDEWRDPDTGFDAFLDHIGPKTSPAHSLDRINNNLGYEPNNVRWATKTEQANNTRRNGGLKDVLFTVDGVTQTLEQWSQQTGLSIKMLRYRVNNGYTGSHLFSPSSR